MKQFLIIPMGGLGSRFIDAGYKTYKPFLKVSKKTRIIDGIIDNFPISNTHVIILGNKKKYTYISTNLRKKNITFIKIKNHNSGPLYSIFLAKQKLKEILSNKNFFISYSDINWKWDFKKAKSKISDREIVALSHKGFHPHLEIDTKSDFFTCNSNNNINRVSEKKVILKDYKNNFLATGCYYFKNFSYFDDYFNHKDFRNDIKKKEAYIINLLNFCLKKNIKINHYLIDKFVHLGLPHHYNDYLRWKNTLLDQYNKSIKMNNTSIMLMAGEGKRLKSIREKKPFLNFGDKKIYEYILKKFGSKKNFIITSKNNQRFINKKSTLLTLDKSNSMLETILKSLILLKNKKNFFILSCDCFGHFAKSDLIKFINKRKSDIVIFGFKMTKLQRSLSNAHSTIRLKNRKIKSINVKKKLSNYDNIGHAGFFWVRKNKVFNKLQEFYKKTNLKREILLDDYFKFIFDNKFYKVDCFELSNYVHIGSMKEYNEFKYWENYFKNEN